MPQNTPKKQPGTSPHREGQGTDARFVEETRKRLLREQLREDVGEERLQKGAPAANDAEFDEEVRLAEQETGRDHEASRAFQRERIRVLRKTASTQGRGSVRTKNPLLGASRFMGIGLLMWAGFIQFIFGIFSAVGFGLAASCTTTGGKIVCGTVDAVGTGVEFVTGINLGVLFAFEHVGWIFWSLILLITVLVFLGFLLFFILQRIPVFGNAIAFMGAGICLALNLIPFLNIFPWIELWAGYWIMSGALPKGLSSVVKKAQSSHMLK